MSTPSSELPDRPQWRVLAIVLLLPFAVLALWPLFPADWLFMWGLAFSIFLSCKLLTVCRVNFSISWLDGANYIILWPGLNASSFLASQTSVSSPTKGEWAKGAISIAIGALCFFGAAPFATESVVRAWLGMIGVVMILHFGVFQCLSCAWRAIGVCAPSLMNRPLASTSLSEFWGRRWNTAFRDFANQFFFKPFSRKLTPHAAMLIAFLFSGVVHDVVISLPARGGYGMPTLFFIIQAAGMALERSRAGRAIGLMRGWRGWWFTALVLILPAPLLFHGPFLERIILPMMQDLGALP